MSHFVAGIGFPAPGSVSLAGRLSGRYQANLEYLAGLHHTKRDWMLEPHQKRGQRWVLEPHHDPALEVNWAGEYAGKWLDAACRASAGRASEPLNQHAAAFAAELVAAQDPDGYLGIESAASRKTAEWDVWNIMYSLAGLLTHYEVNHDRAALRAARRGGEWLVQRFSPIVSAHDPFFRSAHAGGVSAMILSELVRLYRFTGERQFLSLATSIAAHFPPLENMRATKQAWLMHAYVLTGVLGGVVELALAEHQAAELAWVQTVWEDLASRHLYPTGSLGFDEELRASAPNDTPVDGGWPARNHQETCATVEWMLLNARLFQATGHVRYIDRLEQSIYNALLSAQSLDGQQWMYYLPLRYEKRWFGGPTRCCYWSGPRGLARLPEWVYALDADGLRVNLFEASDLTFQWARQSVSVKQVSAYPDSGQVALHFRLERPASFTVRLRLPAQASAPCLWINGRPALPRAVAGYLVIDRLWSDGDRVELEFGILVTTRPFLTGEYGVFVRGPEVLALDQRDNGGLDLDQVALLPATDPRRIEPDAGRRRYQGPALVAGRPQSVIFTPYADCGADGARFRTAFPLSLPTTR